MEKTKPFLILEDDPLYAERLGTKAELFNRNVQIITDPSAVIRILQDIKAHMGNFSGVLCDMNFGFDSKWILELELHSALMTAHVSITDPKIIDEFERKIVFLEKYKHHETISKIIEGTFDWDTKI